MLLLPIVIACLFTWDTTTVIGSPLIALLPITEAIRGITWWHPAWCGGIALAVAIILVRQLAAWSLKSRRICYAVAIALAMGNVIGLIRIIPRIHF